MEANVPSVAHLQQRYRSLRPSAAAAAFKRPKHIRTLLLYALVFTTAGGIFLEAGVVTIQGDTTFTDNSADGEGDGEGGE